MAKNYIPLLLLTYAAALALCVICRTYLLFGGRIAAYSGLYTGGNAAVMVFNMSLLVFICLWFVMTIFRRTGHDYPIYFKSTATRGLQALTGLGILACVVADSMDVITRARGGRIILSTFSSYLVHSPTASTLLILALKILTGVLGAAALILFAMRGDLRRFRIFGVFPAVWQIIVLLERFTGYIAPTQISDTMLMILFMIFAPVFLLGQSRTICGFKPRDSRNYLIASGFAASLVGFSLTVPKIIVEISRMGIEPRYGYTFFFHVYVFIFSLYATVFLYSYIRCIRKV